MSKQHRQNRPQAAPVAGGRQSTGYDVLVGFEFPTNAQVVARLLAGDNIPMAERGPVARYEPGDVAYDIPECSIPWMLEQGIIGRSQSTAPAPAVVEMHTLDDGVVTAEEGEDDDG